MLFLDKKEEVLDIKLTQFGKYKLSVGSRPVTVVPVRRENEEHPHLMCL